MAITGRAKVPTISSRYTDSDSVNASEEGSLNSQNAEQGLHIRTITAGTPQFPEFVCKVFGPD